MPAGKASCISEGMLGAVLESIGPESAGANRHYRFSIRNQFLHPNHPLGWIRCFAVSIDGMVIEPGATHFVVRDQWIAAPQLPTIADIWWHMREVAFVYLHAPVLRPGNHLVEVSFDTSLFGQTSSLDRHNRRPTLRETLTAEMELAS